VEFREELQCSDIEQLFSNRTFGCLLASYVQSLEDASVRLAYKVNNDAVNLERCDVSNSLVGICNFLQYIYKMKETLRGE